MKKKETSKTLEELFPKKLRGKSEIKFELPEYKIELDISKPYKENLETLQRETVIYIDSIHHTNRRFLTKKKLLDLMKIPKMTYLGFKKRLGF